MQGLVKKDITKRLDAEVVYFILDNKRISMV